MFQLLLNIISYGALLLLLMPPTDVGIISTAVVLIIGIGVIIWRKAYRVAPWENKQYYLISIALVIAATLGLSFYNRWLPSSKVQGIAAVLHMPVKMFLLIGSLVLAGLSLYALYAALQAIVKRLSDTDPLNDFSRSIVSCIFASVVTVILAQIMVDTEALSMGYFRFAWGILIVSVAILFMNCLFGRIMPAILVGAGVFMVISTINAYVYQFRGRLFEPVDIFSAGTAMNVAGNYSLLPIPSGVVTGWGVFAAMWFVLYCLQHKSRSKLATQKRWALLAICILSSAAIYLYAANLKTYHWSGEGAQYNGYILDFVSKFKEISAPEPDRYSIELINEQADQYTESGDDGSAAELSALPHIIVIMDEAFSDLGVIGELTTNTEVMPFISSLKENTISGYALTSVYGGNTANSEYEFLTGNSMAWLSPQCCALSTIHSFIDLLDGFVPEIII